MINEKDIDYLDRILTNIQSKCNHTGGSMWTECHQCDWISDLQERLKEKE